MTKMAYGMNQRWIHELFKYMSAGEGLQNASYYGGSITNGRRCISIGRDSKLYYDLPWCIIDIRHSGHIYRQAHYARLGTNCQRMFNRVVHNFIRKGILFVVPSETITQGQYRNIGNDIFPMASRQKHSGAIRFVILIPDAFGIER